MRDHRGIMQGAILAVLVVIAGLLFSISRNMGKGQPDPAAAQTPAPETNAPPIAASDNAPASKPAKDQSRDVPPPAAKPARWATHQVDAAAAEQAPPAQAPAPPATDVPAPVPSPTPVPTPDARATNVPVPGSVLTTMPERVPVAPPPPPPAPQMKTVTVPEGTTMWVRLLDRINSDKNRTGDTFAATLDEPLIVDGVTLANRGSSMRGALVEDKQSSRISGRAEVTVEMNRITTIGGDQAIASDAIKREANSTAGRSAAKVGGVAALGAIIGAVAGGGKGAAIGAAAGAGAGTVAVASSKGKPLKLEPETRLLFRLRAPLVFSVDGAAYQQAAASRGSSYNSGSASDHPGPVLRRPNNPNNN